MVRAEWQHIPASMTFLLGDTAAVSSSGGLRALKAVLSSLIHAEKAGLSDSGPFSQPT